MSEENKIDLELDLKGLLCPLPMVKVSQNIGKVEVGGIIRAVATDPGAMADIPAWAKSTGNEVLQAEKVDGQFVFLVKRVK
ncbi:MAG: response regulator SirA [Actinobacteria bacterium HGW-Actinobacteria-6]|jgi:tRNA 2-thiouridine synthesizing protein A|nr:MAG: response regulator SirA [Actinobacteria bacterium HGW-Actinobacteria-6]